MHSVTWFSGSNFSNPSDLVFQTNEGKFSKFNANSMLSGTALIVCFTLSWTSSTSFIKSFFLFLYFYLLSHDISFHLKPKSSMKIVIFPTAVISVLRYIKMSALNSKSFGHEMRTGTIEAIPGLPDYRQHNNAAVI